MKIILLRKDESGNPAAVKVMLRAVQSRRAGCIKRQLKGAVDGANDLSEQLLNLMCHNSVQTAPRKVSFLFWVLIFGNYWS